MDFKSYFMGLPTADRDGFAMRCETSRAHLTNIAYGQKPCGEKLAIAIERESLGSVRCEDLRPDVDWGYLRGTVAVDHDETPKTEATSEAA